MKNTFYFLVFLIQFMNGANASPGTVIVYFIPFQVETLVPVTFSTITCKADEIWQLSDRAASHLASIIVPIEKATFDEYRVRIKIVSSNASYFIDTNGVVLKNGESFQISKEMFNRFVISIPKKKRVYRKDRTCPGE